jgi:hypothetical protein
MPVWSLRGGIYTPLDNPTTMPMRRHLEDSFRHGVEHEAMSVRRQRLQAPLHNVIPIRVLGQSNYGAVERLDETGD